MYLTKIENLKGDDYKVHRYVKSLMEGIEKVLFFRGSNQILIVSNQGTSASEDYSEKINQISNGDKLIYTTRICPMKTCRINGKVKRVPVFKKDLNNWEKNELTNKFEKSGFKSNHKSIKEGKTVSNKNGNNIIYYPLLINGVITVLDKDKFSSCLLNGIGRMKFLGMGMINIYDFL